MASDTIREARERLRENLANADSWRVEVIDDDLATVLDFLDAADQADEGRCDQKTRWRCGECDVHLVGCDCECHKEDIPVCTVPLDIACKHCAEVFTRDPMKSDDGRCICACHAPAAKRDDPPPVTSLLGALHDPIQTAPEREMAVRKVKRDAQ